MPNQFEETLRSVDVTIRTLSNDKKNYSTALDEFEKNCKMVIPAMEYVRIQALLVEKINRLSEQITEYGKYRKELLEYKKVE